MADIGAERQATAQAASGPAVEQPLAAGRRHVAVLAVYGLPACPPMSCWLRLALLLAAALLPTEPRASPPKRGRDRGERRCSGCPAKIWPPPLPIR